MLCLVWVRVEYRPQARKIAAKRARMAAYNADETVMPRNRLEGDHSGQQDDMLMKSMGSSHHGGGPAEDSLRNTGKAGANKGE
jgi:hypothetical protein